MRPYLLLSVSISSLSLFLCVPTTSFAEDAKREVAVIVSATSLETDAEKVGSTVTVVTGEAIEERQQRAVEDVLRDVPGVDIVQSGGRGGNSAIFIRGANSEHTLVLIDGIEANNPITASRTYNLANLPAENVDRVEILRGPQSTLYGSDAIGGVIQIVTKRGEGPPELTASAEGGSYDTYIQRAGVSGGDELFDYSGTFYHESSRSISAAEASDGNSEKDGYEDLFFSTRLGLRPDERVDLDLFFRHGDSTSELDDAGGPGGDDPNRELDDRQLFTRAELGLDIAPGIFKQIYSVSFADQEFDDDNDPDSSAPNEIQRSSFEGETFELELRNVLEPADWIRLLFGVESEEEQGESFFFSDGAFGPFESNFEERDAHTEGYYVQLELSPFDRLSASLGTRVDDHSQFGSELTWRAATALRFPETGTRLHGSVGTGFKAPSLFQLYSSFGNEDLRPEESIGVDAGVEQALFRDALTGGVVFFHNEFEELITFEPSTFVLMNIDEARSTGLEAYLEAELPKGLELRVAYTFTDTEDESTGEELLRRPRNKLSAEIGYQLGRLQMTGAVRYAGERRDNDFSTFPETVVSLSSYKLVDIAASYRLTETVKLFARVDNVFDEEYEEVLGFGERGAAAYGGVEVRI